MYLGPDKIVATVDNEDGTVKINLENDVVLKWPKGMFEACATEEKSDVTVLFDTRVLRATQKLVEMLLSEDVKIDEIDSIFTRTQNLLNDKLDMATANLWREHMKHNPKDKNLLGLQVLKERTIGDLDGVLTDKNNGNDKDNSSEQSDTSPSEGDSPVTGNTQG